MASLASGGWAPYSTVRAKPLKSWLNHIVIVPWQTLPQASRDRGRPSVRATRVENFGRSVSVSTAWRGWWKQRTYAGSTLRRNRIIARVSGSERGLGPDS